VERLYVLSLDKKDGSFVKLQNATKNLGKNDARRAFYSRQLCLCPFPAYSVFNPATQSAAVSHQQNGLKHAQQH